MKIDQTFPNILYGQFDSLIEEEFAHVICKLLESGIEIENQVEFNTKLADFRGDFLIKNDNLILLIELDGEKFHKKSHDIWRDAFILGEEFVDAIIRFKGKDIIYNLNECIYILSELYPTFFSSRAQENIPTLLDYKNRSAIDLQLSENKFSIIDKLYLEINYKDEKLIKKTTTMEVTYQIRPKGYWSKFYEFAIRQKVLTIENLNKLYFR